MITEYPWTKQPLIVSAPMRLISLAPLAVAVSQGGGIGFVGAGTDLGDLRNHLSQARLLLAQHPIPAAVEGILPVGVGFIIWGADIDAAAECLEASPPAAVWLFAPEE